MKAVGSVVLLWLISVSAAFAAPGTRGAAGPVCDSQTTTLRKLARIPKSFGGPLKQAPLRPQFGLTDPTARLLRGTRGHADPGQAAIQNDAPAARIDHGDCSIPALRALGLLVRAVDDRPRSPAFSPRSPRGPPFRV